MRNQSILARLLACALVLAGCGERTQSAPSTNTATPIPSPIFTSTASLGATPTFSSTLTPTATPSLTAPPTLAPSPTLTATPSETPTVTPTVTSTAGTIDDVPLSATIQAPGLGGTTDVIFDEYGMPHVFAPDTGSALFVQGYLSAAARFWEMDAFRRLAEGRLSELIGGLAVSQDAAMRTIFTTRDGRRLEEALWEYVQAVDLDLASLAQAYTDGINAWLADLRAGRNGATLPPEYQLPPLVDETAATLADWRPQDTLAIGRLQSYELSQTLDEEIGRARIVQALPADLVSDVFRSAPATPATVLGMVSSSQARGAARATMVPPLPPLGKLQEISTALADLQRFNPFGTREHGAGSNNWVVSPALSANGFAMLANDPHLQLFNPPIWHMIQLEAGSAGGAPLHANGVIFPGLPGVILGHNDFGAWGGTVAGFDVTDVYLETVTTPPDYPASPRTVLFKGQQVPVLRVEETIQVKNGAPLTTVIEVVPHHGPMVPDPNVRDTVVGLAATNMSFRWTGHEITDDSRFLIDLDQATNVTEFRSAVRKFAVGAQNWVWADIHGGIAYFPYALIPQRPAGTVPYLPMDGTGSAEWLTDSEGRTLWLPEERIPQATNPPAGFLATANNDQIGNTLDNDALNDTTYLAYNYDLGFREQRIQELLSNSSHVRPDGAKITAADMSAYQYDRSSKEAARLLPFLFAAAAARPDLVTPDMTAALERLQAWGAGTSGTAPYSMDSGIDAHDLRSDVAPRRTPVSDVERTNAVAASIFGAWETRLVPAVFADDFKGTGIAAPSGQDATKALLHILEDIDRMDSGFRVYTKSANGESTLWDDKGTQQVETRDEILLAALRDGLTFLQGKFTTSAPENWLWGVIHQARLQHFYGQAGLSIYDLGPFAAPGGRFTINVADYALSGNNFEFRGGPSERFVAVLDPAGIRAVNALPGGENGNPGSPGPDVYNAIHPDIHYGDLISGWINGETFAYHITHADVAHHAVRKVRYTP
jgi:penicillin amidase